VRFQGKPLDCADCHQVDASGEYHQRITYAAQCRVCHALQFDENNPDLTLPHGDAAAVHSFLHSLDTQYADHARQKGIIEKPRLEAFVAEQILKLRQQDGTGENLEARVFFGDRRTAPAPRIGTVGGLGPAKYAGCAYCHEVQAADGAAVPRVTPPRILDRWFVRGAFRHQTHGSVPCATCHAAAASDLTSDILMPKKSVCVECHSPAGHGPSSGARHDCALCHSYHTLRK
jgi:predicted CXXCH cytochrome family protein